MSQTSPQDPLDPVEPFDPLDTFLERYRDDVKSGQARPASQYVEELRDLATTYMVSPPRQGDPPGSTGMPTRAEASSRGTGIPTSAEASSSEAADPWDLGPGSRLGPYRILSELGRGGQAVVLLAEDTRLGRKVALKILSGLGPRGQEQLRRFWREAEVASRLDHPGICSVLDAGVEGGVHFIAMRCVEGQTLAHRLSTSRGDVALPRSGTVMEFNTEAEGVVVADADVLATQVPDQKTVGGTLEIVEKIARALHRAHEAGIVHRDIKPGNIMLGPDGNPVILDFGLAAVEEEDGPTLTRTGEIFGTPAYMSPEQVLGNNARLDRRSDIFSLGATLFECLTLTRPFDAPTRQALYQAIVSKSAPDPRRLNPHVSRDLKVVLETSLEKDRDRRYQTALALAEDLRRVRCQEPILARPVPLRIRLLRWTQRNPALATSIFSVFLALAAGLGAALFLLDQTKTALSGEARARRAAVMAEDEANRNLDEYERMADVKRLVELSGRATESWPPVPGSLEGSDGIEQWLTDAGIILRRLPAHVAALLHLERNAKPIASDDAGVRADAWEALERAGHDLEAAGPAGEAWSSARLQLVKAMTALHDVRTRFDDPVMGWRHDVLRDLVSDLEAFVDTVRGVERHRDFVSTVRDKTIVEPASLWEETRRAIADRDAHPRYLGFELEPQLGLIPLGQDPESGLFEFLHVQTGAPPVRDPETGRWRIGEDTGIVLVLLPPGTYRTGVQKSDSSAPHFDDNARPMDPEFTEAAIAAPLFISKYEVTQGQWLRATGRNPSESRPGMRTHNGRVDLSHPVEQLSWLDCVNTLPSMGLGLPTEGEWEHACRAGTEMVWWTGNEPSTLQDAANLADRFFHANGGVPTAEYEDALDDGHTWHAPVGTYRPNPFGLHDTAGNVWEWCHDTYRDRHRVVRGGSYRTPAGLARSGARSTGLPEYRFGDSGVRPVRPVDR